MSGDDSIIPISSRLSLSSQREARQGTIEQPEADTSPADESIAILEHGTPVRAVIPVQTLMRSRTGFQRVVNPPRISLNGLLIGLLGVVALIGLGFYPVNLTSPLQWWGTPPDKIVPMQYTLQLPFSLFLAALLGPFMGVMAVLTYVAVGLFIVPVFANGGGWSYLLEPGFGYWLGALVAAGGLSRSFHRIFNKDVLSGNRSRSLKLLKRAVISMLIVHAVGIIYLVFLAVIGYLPPADLPGWFLRLSLEPLPYDVLAAVMLTALVRLVRWILTVPLY